jgi:hypothetical protein
MSIRISQGGRLFGIMAALGGAAMSVSAGLTWTRAFFVTHDYFVTDGHRSYVISELRGADRRAVLVLGFFVIAGAVGFIALGSRRMRMTAGALVVLTAAAGLAIALRADPRSIDELSELPCTNPGPPCFQGVARGGGRVLAGLGAVLAAGYGIVALLRSGGEARPIPATERPAGAPSGAGRPGHPTTPPERRLSDASLLAWTVVAIVIALGVGFFVAVWSICSDPAEWC